MCRIRLVFFLFLTIYKIDFICSHETVKSDEADSLYAFFQTAFTYSEAGYVFYDKKPVCFDTFCDQLYVFEPGEWHKISVSLYAVKKLLKLPVFCTGDFLIHIDDKNGIILYINRQLFLDTVQSNLSLFQYILGPEVTPELLLKDILDPKQSFFSVLKDDKVLIGIVLGYGTQNALYESRAQNIESAKSSEDIPPHSSKVHLCQTDLEKQILLFFPTEQSERETRDQKYLQPSFGFTSLVEELDCLEKKTQISSQQLDKELPTFIFGCLADDKMNQQLIGDLEATQKKIQTLLKSPSFLADVLERIAGRPVEIEKGELSCLSVPDVNINVAAAKLLKGDLEGFEKKYYPFFAKGLVEYLEDHLDAGQSLIGFPECIQNIRSAKKNLMQANQFFSSLQKESHYFPILEQYLYYKTLEPGHGLSLEKETEVTLDFDIFDPTGKCLITESNLKLDLQNTIPGFAHGLRGMKVGERREICIHPALAYGIHTFLPKGIYLRAVVKLLDVQGSEGKLPDLTPTDLTFVLSDQFQQECEENLKQILGSLGTLRGRFFKTCPGFDLASIAESLQHLNPQDELTQEEVDALNRVFWNYYFAQKR